MLRIGIRRPELVKSLILMDTSADGEMAESMGQYRLMLFLLRWLGYWSVIWRALPMFFGPKFLNNPSRRQEVAYWRSKMTSNDRMAMYRFGHGIFSRKQRIRPE